MTYKMATVAEIEAEAQRFQAQVGDQFSVHPNGYGVYIQCNNCKTSSTRDAYRFPHEHVCSK